MSKCLSPIMIHNPLAFKKVDGEWIRFNKFESPILYVPCGKCYDCVKKKRRAFSMRVQEHMRYNPECVCVTFTYDEASVPKINDTPTLRPSDVSAMVKRLRSRGLVEDLSYFGCGEYGPKTLRPHYHIIFFGRGIRAVSYDVWRSLWPHGIIKVGDRYGRTGVSLRTINYCAKYCIYRPTSAVADAVANKGIVKPKLLCSKGIGLQLLEDPQKVDFIVATGRAPIRGFDKCGCPSYYSRKVVPDKVKEVRLKDYSDHIGDNLVKYYEEVMSTDDIFTWLSTELPELIKDRERKLHNHFEKYNKL